LKARQTVYYDPGNLFVVAEVVPSEVIGELDEQKAIGPQKLVADLLQDGALRVDLAQDTVVSTMGPEVEIEKQLSRYAERLVSFMTLENYDLAIIATEEDELVAHLAELAAGGKAVLGVKSEHLARTRILHDKLTEIANRGRPSEVVMEN
jgi:hypothetical protein